jgi:hypothetical protein
LLKIFEHSAYLFVHGTAEDIIIDFFYQNNFCAFAENNFSVEEPDVAKLVIPRLE